MKLQEYLAHNGVGAEDWDLVLFGDGSGSGWAEPGGYASILIDRRTLARHIFYGAMVKASITTMEMLAHLTAIRYHFHKIRSAKQSPEAWRTVVFTDSAYVANMGNAQPTDTRKNGDLWAAFEWYTQYGYEFKFIWVPRNSTPLHALADDIAGKARRALMSADLHEDDGFGHTMRPDVANMMPWLETPKETARRERVIKLCPVCDTPAHQQEQTCQACAYRWEEHEP